MRLFGGAQLTASAAKFGPNGSEAGTLCNWHKDARACPSAGPSGLDAQMLNHVLRRSMDGVRSGWLNLTSVMK